MAFQPRDYSPSLIFRLKTSLKDSSILREAHPRGEASYEPASTAQPIAPMNALRQQQFKSFTQFIPCLKSMGILAIYLVKHFQIETWLDLTQISIEPDIENQMTDKQTRSPASDIA